MKIEILGPGCQRCQALEQNAKKAVEELGLQAEIVKITDMAKITGYGIMSTPGIVLDGEVKGAGRLFSTEEVKGFLQH